MAAAVAAPRNQLLLKRIRNEWLMDDQLASDVEATFRQSPGGGELGPLCAQFGALIHEVPAAIGASAAYDPFAGKPRFTSRYQVL